jgi:hypothetical protein
VRLLVAQLHDLLWLERGVYLVDEAHVRVPRCCC